MKSLIKRVLYKLYTIIGNAINRENNVSYRKLLSSACQYQFESELSKYIYKEIKPITQERIELIPIYQIMPKGVLELESASQKCYRVKNAKIRSNADYIIINNEKVLWSKQYLPTFTKNIPQDMGLLEYNQDTIYIQKHSLEIVEYENVFSLCGVYGDVWSHFMLQYLVKLYNLLQLPQEVLFNLTILTPEYADLHIKNAVHRFVEQYLPNCKIATLKKDEIAHCKKLYWMDNTTDMIEHVSYVCPFDMITPAYVAQQMKQYFVPKYEEKGASGVKLYITRHGQWRNMTNNNEVETYFESIGFQVIEAHKLDYDTKIQLFQNATEIVGPYSSGFANLVFCRPNTKVLIFSNIQRTLENFLAFYVQNFQLDAMYVTGHDEMPSDPDSPFTISLERIQSAYEELTKNK